MNSVSVPEELYLGLSVSELQKIFQPEPSIFISFCTVCVCVCIHLELSRSLSFSGIIARTDERNSSLTSDLVILAGGVSVFVYELL